MTFDAILPLIWQGVRDPRGTARRLLEFDLPLDALWSAMVLVVILGVLLTGAANLIAPPPPEAQEIAVLAIGPFAQTVLLTAMQVALVLGLYRGGRAMGGTGTLAQTLLLTTFLQVMLLAAQIVQLALLILMPPLAGLFMIFVFFGAIVVLLIFVDELHGFASLGKALILFLLVSVGVGLVVMLLVTLTGQTVTGAA